MSNIVNLLIKLGVFLMNINMEISALYMRHPPGDKLKPFFEELIKNKYIKSVLCDEFSYDAYGKLEMTKMWNFMYVLSGIMGESEKTNVSLEYVAGV